MCVIQGATSRIADTQILAFPTADKRSQVTVYSNAVQLKGQEEEQTNSALDAFFPGYRVPSFSRRGDVAMILPIPRGYERFDVIDTTDCADMFKEIDECFPEQMSFSLFSTNQAQSASFLAVKTCGSYKYSLVPSLADFSRVDPNVFKLDAEVGHLLGTKYPRGFAFLVCKIEESKKFHPIAYVHPMPEDGKLFVPTLHFHQGHHDQSHPDWDHQIYVVGNNQLGKAADSTEGLQSVKCLKPLVPRVSPSMLRKIEIKGDYPNKDLLVPVAA